MDEHLLRAPSVDGALLCVPPLNDVPSLLSANVARLSTWEYDFQGRSAGSLRGDVRGQILKASARYLKGVGIDVSAGDPSSSLIVTGHQPELFHPGVWVKNFAIARLARTTGSLALNLIIDNDLPKSSSIKVPRRTESELGVEKIPFDEWAGEIPYEDLNVEDEALFESFGRRVRQVLGDAVDDPAIDAFWPFALKAKAVTNRIGLRFAAARRALEASWGIHNLELPLSVVCESEGFQWFACHLIAQLPRFQEVHNDALKRYRERYKIRSSHHPVPALGRQGDWLEAPFWVWRTASPRRKPLMARQLSNTIELRVGGEDETLLELPLGPDRDACCAVERLLELPSRGVRLRTRALTTTMFARFLLGDLFVHGIGGAKYDELGDEISGTFFGFEPPRYLTTSLTLRLGLGAASAGESGAGTRLTAAEHLRRDLTWNPDRYLGDRVGDEAIQHLLAAKRAALVWPQAMHSQRIDRYRELRRCNGGLREHVAGRIAALEPEIRKLRKLVVIEALARSREYSLILHSTKRLQSALAVAIPGLFDAD